MASDNSLTFESPPGATFQVLTVDEARQKARERFRDRLAKGEAITGCECASEEPAGADGQCLIGVRFLDSGQIFYFDPGDAELDVGDWVVVKTERGQEAGKVVLAPHQVVLNKLKGELLPIERKLSELDVEQMSHLKTESAAAVRRFSELIRRHNLNMKPISAEFSFDRSVLTLSFSAPERVDFRALTRDLASEYHCRVELRQVSPRDEARLLGGLGRCGRTLCCASWLPFFPEISMNMAKTQDLPLNPSKVSGVCGRLLCCLSYENEQYRRMKQVMPKLGQEIETPMGPGMVMSMQILKELVTVRLEQDGSPMIFPVAELSFGDRQARVEVPQREAPMPPPTPPIAPEIATPISAVAAEPAVPAESASSDPSQPDGARNNRRRRRRGRGGNSGGGQKE